MKPDPITRAFVLALVIAVAGAVLAQFVLEGWPAIAVFAAGGIFALVAALPVFEAIGQEERAELEARLEAVREEEHTAAAEEWGDGWEGLGRLIAEGEPSTAEYAKGVELAGTISGQLRELAHVGRARIREAELRRAL